MSKIRSVLICILLCILFFLASAQKANLQFYTTQDGLSGSFTHGIVQDNQGFLWVFNDAKLHRFDGRRFEVITPPADLAGSNVWLRGGNIYQDSLLVLQGKNNLFSLNSETGNWQSFPFPVRPNEEAVWELISLSSPDSLFFIKYAEGTWQPYVFNDGQFSPVIQPIKEASDAALLFFCHNGRIYTYPNPFTNKKWDIPQIKVWTPGDASPRKITIEKEGCLIERIQSLKNGMLSVLLWLKVYIHFMLCFFLVIKTGCFPCCCGSKPMPLPLVSNMNCTL